jgi:hypothetical protein
VVENASASLHPDAFVTTHAPGPLTAVPIPRYTFHKSEEYFRITECSTRWRGDDMARNDQTPMNRDDREQPIVNIDPDFYVPAGAERTNSYLRALRILFPKAA